VFFTLFYPSTSPNASFALISFFLHSLTKAPDNNTPAIKITSSSVSLEAMFVARFVAAAFWRGCGQINFCCYSKLRNTSPQQKSTCVIGVSQCSSDIAVERKIKIPKIYTDNCVD